MWRRRTRLSSLAICDALRDRSSGSSEAWMYRPVSVSNCPLLSARTHSAARSGLRPFSEYGVDQLGYPTLSGFGSHSGQRPLGCDHNAGSAVPRVAEPMRARPTPTTSAISATLSSQPASLGLDCAQGVDGCRLGNNGMRDFLSGTPWTVFIRARNVSSGWKCDYP
jgi:hypothetical protein